MRALGAAVVVAIGCRSTPPAKPTNLAPPVPTILASDTRDPTDDLADVVRANTSGAVTYTYRASKVTYLTYTLDCLAKLVTCSTQSFVDSWKPGWTSDDDLAIAAWAGLRARYSGNIVDRTRAVDVPLPIAYHDRDLDTALRIAGFGARDIDDYSERLGAFMGANERTEARAIIERFAPRLDVKWRVAREALVASLDAYVELGNRDDVRALVASIAMFYGIGKRGAQQTFELVARPADAGARSATQLGDHAIVEVVAGERAEGRYSVIAHEMFHAWFGESPIEAQVDLAQQFVASGDPLAGPAWGLLDEVLATALGNGLVARLIDREDHDIRASRPGGFYNDPFIDPVTKALLPALEQRLASKGTVFDAGFVTEYLAAVHTAFPNGMPPIAYLRPLFGVAPSQGSALRQLRQRANPGRSRTFSTLSKAREALPEVAAWGGAILATRPELAAIAPFVPEAMLANAKKQKANAFVIVQAIDPIGARFLFVADDDKQMTALVEAFAQLPAPLKDGVIVP
jgi:hypothetical protein